MRDACARIVMAGLILTACSSGDGGGPPTGNTQTGTITGRVIDADSGDGGVPGVSVQLAGGGAGQSVATGANGTFTLANAATGAWTATLQLPASYRLAANETGTRTATVTAGQVATLTQFRLARPKGNVTGTAEAGGTGIAGGTVEASRGGFGDRTATPTAAGYTISDLPVGTWSLTYSPPATHVLAGGETGTRTVVIAEGATATASAFELSVAPPPPQVVTITLSGTSFLDGTITIPAGTTVRWVNDSNTMHTITPQNATQPGVWQRRETTTQGTVFEHTFTVPNQVYRYRCEPHSSDFQSGMVGMITVT